MERTKNVCLSSFDTLRGFTVKDFLGSSLRAPIKKTANSRRRVCATDEMALVHLENTLIRRQTLSNWETQTLS